MERKRSSVVASSKQQDDDDDDELVLLAEEQLDKSLLETRRRLKDRSSAWVAGPSSSHLRASLLLLVN